MPERYYPRTLLGTALLDIADEDLWGLMDEIEVATSSYFLPGNGNLRIWLRGHFMDRATRRFRPISGSGMPVCDGWLGKKLSVVAETGVSQLLRELSGMDMVCNFPRKTVRVALNELMRDELRGTRRKPRI